MDHNKIPISDMKLFMQKTFQRWLVEKHFQRNMEITTTQWQLLILKDLTVWRLLLDIPYMKTSALRLNLLIRLFVSTLPNLFSEFEKHLWGGPFQSFVLSWNVLQWHCWYSTLLVPSKVTENCKLPPKKLKSATNGSFIWFPFIEDYFIVFSLDIILISGL
jgi:hypothetical protein